jgi:hypothetical protein
LMIYSHFIQISLFLNHPKQIDENENAWNLVHHTLGK